MQQTDESYVLTDWQLQLLLEGCGCTEIYGLPLQRPPQDQQELSYQIYKLVKKQIISVAGGLFRIAEPLKSWLSAAAQAETIYKIRTSGQMPRFFCVYLQKGQAVLMERYVYRENSVRLWGFTKTEFYQELDQLLFDCGMREHVQPLPEQVYQEMAQELVQSYARNNEELRPGMAGKFRADVCDRFGRQRKRITAVRVQLEDFLVQEMKDTVDVTLFGIEKLIALLEE